MGVRLLLRGVLPSGVALLCIVQLGAWAPHYLTWPLWADHDVFATIAQAWQAGERPYRDTLSNNFPGTIYIFWLLGQLAGWGNTAAFYAADVALLLCLGAVLLWWSLRQFSTLIAGLVGFASCLTYYLGLDFAHTAQRDWHATVLCALAILVLQTSPTRASRFLSALLSAFALTIRPHVILFLPALLLAAADNPEGDRSFTGAGRREGMRQWAIAFAIFAALGFLPLLVAGVGSDFVRSIRIAGYGPDAAARSLVSRANVLFLTLSAPKLFVVPLAVLILYRGARSPRARLALPWVVGFIGALAYDPISPAWRSYLVEPLWLMWCVNVGVVAGLIADDMSTSPAMRLSAVLLLLGVSVVPYPTYCSIGASLRALTRPAADRPPPPGYTHTYQLPLYKWDDYRATLDYIVSQTPPETRVASLLFGVAIAGPTGRLSAFPAESATWLDMVDPRDKERFERALEQFTNEIVVWAPGDETLPPHVRELFPLVTRLYRPAATFGAISVWRRSNDVATLSCGSAGERASP